MKLRAEGIEAHPIVGDPKIFGRSDPSLDRTAVLQIALSHFPLPSVRTSWDAIHKFREDDEAKQQLRLLRSWLEKVRSEGLDEYSLRNELATILYSLDKRVRSEHQRLARGRLDAYLLGGTKLVLGALTMDPIRVSEGWVQLKKARANVLEGGEFGSESVGYVADVRTRFSAEA